jgi:protein SCO1/2
MARRSLLPTVLALALSGPRPALADPAQALSQTWAWKDERAQTVTLGQWRGSPVVLTMFYRSCEARCSPTVERLKKVEEAFRRQGAHPHFVLVTLDPRNDTPARLRAFKKSRHLPDQSWHLLSGDGAQTRQLVRLLDFKVAGDDGHFEHETKVFVFDAEGALKKTLHGWRFSDEEATGSPSP